MADMKGFTEKFRVQKVNVSGDTERVTIQLGLDGLKVMSSDGNRTMNSYDLSHISRWSLRSNNLVLYTKTPVDVEERQITLRSDEQTIRNVMDTLTCCCMQLCEILESNGKSTSDKETANSLHQLVKGGGKKKTSLPSVDEVEFWIDAEKSGYLQSQGDVMKTWRRRFFVLKQGYLFRFMDGNLSETSKPRGVVDLSKVTDVKEGKAVTGKPNSILLQTSTGSVSYIADTETEMVEWMSALETAMQHIVKHVAGVDDDDSPRESATQQWMKQLQSNLGNGNGSSGYSSKQTVNVVEYDSGRESKGHTSSSSGGYGGAKYGGSSQGYSSGIDYNSIGGVSGVIKGGPTSNDSAMDDLMLNYGGGGNGSQRPSSNPSKYPQQPTPTSYPPTSQYTSSYYPSYPQDSVPSYQTQSSSATAYPTADSGSYAGYPTQPSSAATGNYGGYEAQPSSANAGGYGGYQQQQQPSANAAGGYSGYETQPSSGYQPQSTAPSASLIDLPVQTPGYPYYQQPASTNHYSSAPQAPAATAPPPSTWQVLYTPDGKAYYHNTASGATQWEAPPGM